MPNYQQMAQRRQMASAISSSTISAATTGLSAGLFIAAAASNAVPIGGQIASGVLAVAGLLTKLFAGKRMEKKAQRQQVAFAQRQMSTELIRQQGAGLGLRAQAGGEHGMVSEEQKFAHHQPTTDWSQAQPGTTYGYMRNNGGRR